MKFVHSLRQHISRFGVYGDYLTRLQGCAVRWTPFYLETLLIAGWAVLFYALCHPLRRGLTANLNALFPDSSCWVNSLRAYVVFLDFSVSLTDGIRMRQGEDIVDWEIEGRDHLDALMEGTSGAILMTAHMGNYDLAARLFAERSNRKIHAVRAPERTAAAQEMRERELASGGNLAIQYNRPDGFLGIDLIKAIAAGEIVAIQGDRTLFDVTPLPVPIAGGHSLQTPKGPFVLAATGQCPICPVFIFRAGYRRYRVLALEPFHCERRRGAAQEESIRVAATHWVEVLLPVIRSNWSQWFVFDSAFTPTEPKP